MNIAATTEPVAAIPGNARLEQETVYPPRLWLSIIAAWTRHLDRRIEEDLRWLDHPGALEDFRRASRG
jgi:hypothetical protein